MEPPLRPSTPPPRLRLSQRAEEEEEEEEEIEEGPLRRAAADIKAWGARRPAVADARSIVGRRRRRKLARAKAAAGPGRGRGSDMGRLAVRLCTWVGGVVSV